MLKAKTLLLLLAVMASRLLCAMAPVSAGDQAAVSLSGEWKLRLGGNAPDSGAFDAAVNLPGSLQAQGFGNDISADTKWVGVLKDTSWLKYSGKQPDGSYWVAGWLQPAKHYVGKAWYRKKVEIPESWKGKRIRLFLERVHVSSEVFVDGEKVGSEDSLAAPHIYDLGHLTPGPHVITISVDNTPPPIGKNAHGVTDHTQTDWNGIIGKIELQAMPEKYVDYIMTFPDAKNKRLAVKVVFAGGKSEAQEKLTIKILPPKGAPAPEPVVLTVSDGNEMDATVEFAETAQWDEFEPGNIYTLTATLDDGKGAQQEYSTRFGFYTHKVRNQQFVINGRPTLFRGTLDCASFPLTGYPSMDIDYWRHLFKVCKDMGLNHIRYHSWTPPEVAFDAADEMGFYLQCENGWANVGRPNAQAYLMKESEKVIRRFGNHPSFMLAAYGNEPGGRKKGGGKQWLSDWVETIRKLDGGRKFYTSSAGWATSKNSDYYDIMRGMRVYPWKAGLKSSINANPPEFASNFDATTKKDPAKPYVAHETGQWCVFPDFDEMKLYTGFLKPRNYEIFRKNMEDNHLLSKWRRYFDASGKLQTLCYKFEIEKLRRTRGCGGYQLLGINDFPGQGTALVGPVNVFWKVKSYTSSAEYRCFNGKTVILGEFPKLIYKSDEKIVLDVAISHYGETPLRNAELLWTMKDKKGALVASGSKKIGDIGFGLSTVAKSLTIPLDAAKAPAECRIVFSIKDSDIKNYYDVWVYPADAKPADTGDIVVTDNGAKAVAGLAKGASVLFVPESLNMPKPKERAAVLGFSTIFWNTVWAKRQPPTVMGVELDPNHPLFKNFPTDSYSNYQWWYIISKTKNPLYLDSAPADLNPIVNIIDDWFTNRRLALLVEAKVGKGKLMVTPAPILKSSPDNIVLNQFRNAVINYMKSADFAPSAALSAEYVESLTPPAR